MTDVELRPLRADDLPFLGEVRHHPETLCHLHDQRVFPANEVARWFAESAPAWYVIEHGGERVGYVRTSQVDERNRSLCIGADVHPDYRRRGFATAAYRLLIGRLRREGWHRVWLEVLPDNAAARALYEKLGFRSEGRKAAAVRCGNRWLDSVVMGLILDPHTGVNAKVVAVYTGRRRSPPATPREAFALLRFLLEKERTVDPGCQADTLLVHNRFGAETEIADAEWARRCEELLARCDGLPTARGRIRVLVRENTGLSFGAYNHAFGLYRDEYDYWLFTEDDQVPVRDGYFATAVGQMQSDPRVGFVAVVGVSTEPQYPPHAHGGVGVSERGVLKEVVRANACGRHPGGHLPYHAGPGYEDQELLGEVRFTNAIHGLGYRLVNLELEEACVSWGHPWRRTPRMASWGGCGVDDATAGGLSEPEPPST